MIRSTVALALSLPILVALPGQDSSTPELLAAAGFDPAAPPEVGTPAGEFGAEGLLGLPQLPVLAHPRALEMLTLRDGSILWGALAGHRPEGVTVQRLDTGGILELPFELLDPRIELELRTRFGYVDTVTEEVFVSADRIPLDGGGELIGIVQHRANGVLHVKQETGVVLLPALRVAGAITKLQVPARSLYTREELVEQERTRLLVQLESEGEVRSAALFELAAFAERVSDYRTAAENYDAIPEADRASFADFEAALARSRAKAKVQEQVDFLDDAVYLSKRERFARALEVLGEFPGRYPDSPLTDDWLRTVRRVENDRDRELSTFVTKRWFTWTARFAREGAKLETFEQTREWVDEQLGDLVADAVAGEAQDFVEGISGTQVRAIFADRRKPASRRASYGKGTWLLGRDEALAGKLVEPEEEEVAVSDRDAERQALLDRIERYQRNTQSLGGASRDADLEPEDAWKRMNLSQKALWITAYYAEQGGDFSVVSVTLLPHRDCAGLGYREILESSVSGDTRTRLELDPYCGGLGVTRRVTYR